MKILSIGNFTSGWDGSICDEEHIASALEELGHEVTRAQRGEVNTTNGTNDYDFTLIAQWDGYGDLSWLPKPLVYWAFDYQAEGQEWHERLVEESDLYLSKRIVDSKYPNWQWLAQDFAPKFLDKHPETVEKNIDVLFTGSYLPWATERNQTLKAVDEKFNLRIYSVNPAEWMSAGFKHVNGPVMDDALPALIARAKINLSIDHTLEAGYWSDRNAQIMACGGFVLTRYVPLMEAVFHSFVGYFYDIDTCLRSIEYWIEADEDRESLAAYGYEYAQEHLKVRERVDDMINIVQGIL
jgi:hypothetical protein